jgi:hypothetical protein
VKVACLAVEARHNMVIVIEIASQEVVLFQSQSSYPHGHSLTRIFHKRSKDTYLTRRSFLRGTTLSIFASFSLFIFASSAPSPQTPLQK